MKKGIIILLLGLMAGTSYARNTQPDKTIDVSYPRLQIKEDSVRLRTYLTFYHRTLKNGHNSVIHYKITLDSDTSVYCILPSMEFSGDRFTRKQDRQRKREGTYEEHMATHTRTSHKLKRKKPLTLQHTTRALAEPWMRESVTVTSWEVRKDRFRGTEYLHNEQTLREFPSGAQVVPYWSY